MIGAILVLEVRDSSSELEVRDSSSESELMVIEEPQGDGEGECGVTSLPSLVAFRAQSDDSSNKATAMALVSVRE